MNLNTVTWRKSRHGGSCVEVAACWELKNAQGDMAVKPIGRRPAGAPHRVK